jgi:copper homeostasis protein CutC
MRLLLEVIVQSVDDARAATLGGADRLEVVRDIRQGGLTPPLDLVRAIAAETSLPLRVVVRENAGHGTTPEELETLRAAARGLQTIGVDGIVVGYAKDGVPSLDDVARVIEAAPEVKVTFHRAFDSLADPFAAIDAIAGLPQIDRILTSGGEGAPAVRCERLHSYTLRGRPRLIIIAGGGVDERCLALFATTRCVDEVHIGRLARDGYDPEAPVSVARVKRLRDMAG